MKLEKVDDKTAYENLLIKYAELEKENAELKEQNRNYEQLIDNGSVTLVKERLKNYKQLTKAKEIIREIMKYEILTLDYEKAEQFLKEIEK